MLTLDRNEGVGMSHDSGAGVSSKESTDVVISLAASPACCVLRRHECDAIGGDI